MLFSVCDFKLIPDIKVISYNKGMKPYQALYFILYLWYNNVKFQRDLRK